MQNHDATFEASMTPNRSLNEFSDSNVKLIINIFIYKFVTSQYGEIIFLIKLYHNNNNIFIRLRKFLMFTGIFNTSCVQTIVQIQDSVLEIYEL